MTRRRLTSAGLLLALSVNANGQASDETWLSPAELRAIITDRTVTGRYSNGEPYSEYHAPDGRVLGHNNREPNQNACWDIKGDQVCYYYAKGRARGEFCWRFQRIGDNGIRARLVDRGGREIIGVVRVGNPNNHTDNGNPWTCDPMTSENMTPRAPAARHASR